MRSKCAVGDLRLALGDAVHQRAGVDLAVRMRIRGADCRAPVLEDQHVGDAVDGLQRSGPVAPRAHDRGHFVVGEVGHRLRGVVVVADDLGGADRSPGAVQVVAAARLGRVGRRTPAGRW